MIAAGQHRLRRVQLVNWGTFNGALDLPVPREGLLVTGPSGSGKSSLLDALASILVQPRWLSFNAAAQEGGAGDRTRSLVSYVRGAYKRESDDAGEVTTAYLRQGATWSGAALTFDDGAGQVTSLVRLLHLPRGTNASDAVSTVFLVADEDVDLRGLEPFIANGPQTRQLKAAHPGWSIHPTYSSFAVRLQKRLGLASDQAQRLLHKTQSAKNLASLDSLLRDFMLDEPDTFTEVTRAVDQFGELSAAHSSVVDARRQVEALLPLRALDREIRQLQQQRADVAEQAEYLDTVRLTRHLDGSARTLHELEARLAALDVEVASADATVAERQAERDAARLAVDGLGGQEVASLEELVGQQESHVGVVRRERTRQEAAAREVGLVLPDGADAFAGFCAEAERLASEVAESADGREQRFGLASRHADAKRAAERLEQEIRALDSRRSNIHEGLLGLRDELVEASGAPRERLPFAGELIDVRAGEASWTGAIERVLRPFAQTLLVPDDLYPLVSEHVDRTHLGLRLVYERVPADAPRAEVPEDPRSLVQKVTVVDCEFRGWVEGVLVRRYDYPCVDTAAELRRCARGVTRAGQVRHSQTRHEKDDRSRIDDRHRWLLRSSTDGRRQALARALAEARGAEAAARTARDEADQLQQARTARARQLAALALLEWEQVDVVSVERRLDASRGRLRALTTGNAGYAAAKAGFDRADEEHRRARATRDGLRDRRATTAQDAADLSRRRERWASELQGRPDVPAPTASALGARLDATGVRDLDAAAAQVARQLEQEGRETDRRLANAANRTERQMQTYKAEWPAQGADLAIQADFLPDYLQLLDGLEADRLPDFEDRFFELLQNQSRNNIGALAQRIKNSRREIRERVDPINDSLKQTEYAPGQYLHVRVADRRLPEVTDFLNDLVEITSGSLEDALGSDLSAEARQVAERRFVRMRDLLKRLGSKEPADQRWQQHCLDTRLHVQFVAEVRDPDGRAVDYFVSSGGLSGGERQKLVIFCLAAALRYQLARDGAAMPSYGLVVLDEAFDKTDPAFTRAGLEVFRQFGFQLLLATPLKMLQTLEDYVGGAAVVLNESGRGSRLEVMTFADEPEAAGAGRRPAGVPGPAQQSLL